ncbi:MAG TPA: hypothetical protein VNG31_09775, partial [Candidatus Baltobacteraceae bacterium]|nr:hypothetical protein [Candidatus Baltobacteraceae bacterium]
MRGWIPPVPLALGALFGALSWTLVVLYGITPSFGIALAWIHAVALASFTTIALSVLIHVIPGFTDLSWRGKTVARWSGGLLPFAAAGFVLSFVTGFGLGVAIFGVVCALSILAYASAAVATLVQRAPLATERAIARAFLMVFAFLAVAAILGALLAYGYRADDGRLLQLAPEHAAVALVGWLTLLTMGVSARTFRPILGSSARWRAMHIVSNAAMLLCAIAIPVALGIGIAALTRAAFVVGFVAAALYAADAFDRVRRATTPNRPAHAFVVASLLWLLFSASAAATGAYDVAIVAALAGWLGQMINAHLHHIGIRVIATTFAGDGDETRPWQLLDLRLSWATVVCAQAAVVLLVLGVAIQVPWCFVASGTVGLLAAAAFAT